MRLLTSVWLLLVSLPFFLFADPAPEPATPAELKRSITADKAMVVTANPHATDAAFEILQKGGNAIDAAIAAQMVLGVVEPQSSGLGGGGFLLYWDAKAKKLHNYDGRETAPSTAQSTDFLRDGKPLPFMEAVKSKQAIGTPGLIAMLGKAHEAHGKQHWSTLFQHAEQLARNGFKVSTRLHQNVEYSSQFQVSDAFKEIYFRDDAPVQVGDTLKNPKQAGLLKQLAEKGTDAFYHGLLKQKNEAPWSNEDLQSYQAKEREPVCGQYREYKVCGMAPPSSGGIAVLQTLGILENFSLNNMPREQAIHLILEAQKIAFADRNHYIADPDFVEVPIRQMLDPAYLKQRAKTISPNQASTAPALPGDFAKHGKDASFDAPSTTHLSIVDQYGNAVALTSSVEHSFGSGYVSAQHGIVLNNQLTDFSFVPEVDGIPVANRMEAGKRPRSSMNPTMVFDENDQLVMVLGSPGGSSIIGYVIKTLIGVIDWKMELQKAINAPHFLHKNKDVASLETDHPLAKELKTMGYKVKEREHTSGVHAILVNTDGSLTGAADPRREGTARGL